MVLLRRLEYASGSVFGLSVNSVRASICPSRNASRRHPHRRLGVQYITFLTVYQVLKGDAKLCPLIRAFIFDLRL